MVASLACKLTALTIVNVAEALQIGSLAGEWRKGLPSISFPKWSRSAAAASSSKAKPSPAVNLSGNDVELADFQSMTTRYDSGAALCPNTLTSAESHEQLLVCCLLHLCYILTIVISTARFLARISPTNPPCCTCIAAVNTETARSRCV